MDKETTVVVLKPDALKRKLEFEILQTIQNIGLEINQMYSMKLNQNIVEKQYAETIKLKGEPFRKWIIDYMTSDLVIIAKVTGYNAISTLKELVGTHFDPSKNLTGKIRRDYASDFAELADAENRAVENLIHCSGNPEEAKKEIDFWFNKVLEIDEIIEFNTLNENIEYDLVILKPDARLRNLDFYVLRRLQQMGVEYDAIFTTMITEEMGRDHYQDPIQRHGEIIGNRLVKFMIEAPITVIAMKGNNVVERIRKLAGQSWDPIKNEPGTLRYDLSMDSGDLAMKEERAVRNIIHCSDSIENAKWEIDLWFKDYPARFKKLISH